ncbi:Methylated-DNA--protein-cysteine methyltransferase [hydrothermal vent metagenome]|uniref:methylated-DNA--[protein]-cysteine S-methyltransferase n=1 Tax=hydrothermal vent metagenome TaxID=652676 RepID=A0A3B0W6T5_9ZZZZ
MYRMYGISQGAREGGANMYRMYGISQKMTDSVKIYSPMNKNTLNIIHFDSPVGPMVACATAQGICLVDYMDRNILEDEFKYLAKEFNTKILPGKNKHLAALQKELEEYFIGNRSIFTVPVHASGTDFQMSVWNALQNIPYGNTQSYKQQAEAIGNVKAVRAVASTNGKNRINILIPCHRVIGSNGKLVGYGGGLERKQWLLDLEAGRVFVKKLKA